MKNVLLILVVSVLCSFAVGDGSREEKIWVVSPQQADLIQSVIDLYVNDGDVLQLEVGTYLISETIDTRGRNFTFRGVVDTNGNPASILDGQDSTRVIQCITAEGPEMLFEYLVITGGLAAESGSGNRGGGMYCHYSSPTLTDCVFTGNSAGVGGGMYNYYQSSPTLFNCTFTDNSVGADGGGMYNRDSNPILNGCAFKNNSADADGGGVFNYYYSNPTFTNCTFTSNVSYRDGGAMTNWESSPTLEACTFEGNSSSQRGGGIYNYWSSTYPTLMNCTIEGNTAGNGGGIYTNSGSLMLSDSTVCSNTPNQIIGAWDDGGGNYTEPICTCPGDIDNDGQVDGSDQGLLLIAWASSKPRADLNFDGIVDGGDLGLLLLYWGPCP